MKFQAGEVILQSAPFGAALNTTFLERACSHCLTCKLHLTCCSGCGVMRYCNDKCQQADAVDHRTECDSLRRVAPWIPSPEIRLLCRVWARVRREQRTPSEEIVLGRTRTYQCLLTHRDQRNVEFEQEIIDNIGSQVNRFLSEQNRPDTDSLLTVFMKLDINSHTITSWDGPIGCALYLGGSITDHSCAPDHRISYFFDGRYFIIRAIDNLEIDSVDDLHISYVPFILPRNIRRAQLKRKYFFDCTCQRCLGEDTVANEGGVQLIEQAQQLRTLPDTKFKLNRIIDLLASPETQRLANNDYVKLTLNTGLFALYGVLEMYVDAAELGEQLMKTYQMMDVAAVHHLYLTCQTFTAAFNAGWFETNNPEHFRFLTLLGQASVQSQKVFGPRHHHSKLITSIRNDYPATPIMT